ncbi:MAG: glycosyltransferase family 39 protein [Isosphaeraceae bacterium]
MSASRSVRPPPWAWLALLAILLFDVWWRGHTFGPSVHERLGVNLWPVTGIEAEPLDCDESAYAYIGRRINRGDVMYRDLTENKPPGGYWLYALAVALGGANEWTIRVMPVPLVLLTIVLVWWIGLRLSGPLAACVAAGVYAVMSTDPYLFGNGANLEHALNLCAVASLAFMVRAWRGGGRGAIVTAGVLLGMACLVKQVAFLHGIVYAAALMIRGHDADVRITIKARIRDLAALVAGFAVVWVIAVAVLIAQGAGPSAFDDIIRFGGALVTETPPAPNQPPFFVRWLTGNADPNSGEVPWPFGKTDWLVWWGAGTWPIWLLGVAGLARLVLRPTDGPRLLTAAWTASAWAQVAMPGLFWQHYYLLPTPGLALAVAVLLADAVEAARSIPTRWRRLPLVCVIAATVAALGWTLVIQVRDYLLVKPQSLTIQYKGGAQWVAMRTLGRVLKQRSAVWPSPRLFVWGWQSPLYLYSELDSVTSEFFANELLKAHADGNHPVVRPHIDRLMRDLRARPPELIFTGNPPFPALRDFLLERGYHRSRFGPMPPDGPGSTDMRGLWVEPGRADQFEELFQVSGRAPPPDSALPEPEITLGPEPTTTLVLPASTLVDPTVPVAAIEDQVSTLMRDHGIPGLSAAIVRTAAWLGRAALVWPMWKTSCR